MHYKEYNSKGDSLICLGWEWEECVLTESLSTLAQHPCLSFIQQRSELGRKGVKGGEGAKKLLS